MRPRQSICRSIYARAAGAALVLGCLAIAGLRQPARAAADEPVFSAEQKPIAEDIGHLRSVPDDARSAASRDLATRIRQLPVAQNKLRLALELASLSTEGDFGRATLDQVAATLAAALRESPMPWTEPAAGEMKFEPALMPALAYRTLAQLAHYEGVAVPLEADAHFRAALAKLEADDRKRDHPDFTLHDLSGRPWHMADLRGKVVLVNFWATWCPPCRKELPSLEAFSARFANQGLVVIGISDEDTAKVEPFVRRQGLSYPILLDSGGVVNRAFAIQGIPKSFVYDRSGKLAATAIDMRTELQFLAMLEKAGLR